MSRTVYHRGDVPDTTRSQKEFCTDWPPTELQQYGKIRELMPFDTVQGSKSFFNELQQQWRQGLIFAVSHQRFFGKRVVVSRIFDATF
jgi:hypothetical protein